jgi:hypothetical protein
MAWDPPHGSGRRAQVAWTMRYHSARLPIPRRHTPECKRSIVTAQAVSFRPGLV